MGYLINKPQRFDITRVPAKVSVNIPYGLTEPTADFTNKVGTVCIPLDVTIVGSKVCAVIPERAAACGPGKYYVSIYENCVMCAQVLVRFQSNCKAVDCEVEQVPERKTRRKKGG